MSYNIDSIVSDCIKNHVGGTRFFDALDDQVRGSNEIVEGLVSIAEIKLAQHRLNACYVVSGKFGLAVGSYLTNTLGYNTVILEGSLRFNEIQDQYTYRKMIEGRKCIFIDDSYFSGTTARKVKELVDLLGGKFLGTIVAYDGSKQKKNNVISLYRYYDKK